MYSIFLRVPLLLYLWLKIRAYRTILLALLVIISFVMWNSISIETDDNRKIIVLCKNYQIKIKAVAIRLKLTWNDPIQF